MFSASYTKIIWHSILIKIDNLVFLENYQSSKSAAYISQLIRFARVSSHVADFNARNKSLTAKLLQQGYQYHKLRKTFSKGHLCLWREDSLKEKYNTKYYKI